jgi:hypothetical protein
MRYRDKSGQDWADIIDFLTMYSHAGRTVWVLGEIDAVPNVRVLLDGVVGRAAVDRGGVRAFEPGSLAVPPFQALGAPGPIWRSTGGTWRRFMSGATGTPSPRG